MHFEVIFEFSSKGISMHVYWRKGILVSEFSFFNKTFEIIDSQSLKGLERLGDSDGPSSSVSSGPRGRKTTVCMLRRPVPVSDAA